MTENWSKYDSDKFKTKLCVGHFYTNYYKPETTTLFKRIKKPF